MTKRPSDRVGQDSMLDLPLQTGEAEEAEQLRGGLAEPPPSAPRRGAVPRRRPSRKRFFWIFVLLLAMVSVVAFFLLPTPPRAGFSPQPFDLGQVRVSTAGEPERLTVTNIGERPMPVTGVTITGAAGAEFGLEGEDCSARSLAAQESCAVAIEFAPAEMGERQAVLELHAEMRRSPAEVILTGVGIAPLARVEPTGLRFPRQDVGTSSPAAGLSVANRGTAVLRITSVDVSGSAARDFRITRNQCSRTELKPGDTCDLQVVFEPRAGGAREAEVSILSDTFEPLSPPILEGEGFWTGAAFAIEPQTMDFGRSLVGTEPVRRKIRLTNRQSQVLKGLEVSLDDSGSGFAIVGEDCTARALGPGESCHVEVGFGAAAEGTDSSLLEISHAEVGSLGVKLSGRGVTPRWVLSAASLDFDETRVDVASDSRLLELRNDGSAAATISRVEVVGEDAAGFDTKIDECEGREISPQQRCTVEIRFQPRREGVHSATVLFHASAGGTPQRVGLTAIAVAPRLNLDREAVDFGPVHRTTTSQIDLVASNPGTAPLQIGRLSLAGEGAEEFRLQGGSCFPAVALLPKHRCSLQVGFEPTSEGRHAARLQIAHDGISGPRELLLAGVGLPPPEPRLILSHTRLAFGPRPVGERSPILTVVIRSDGTGRLVFQGFSLAGADAGDFHIVPATCDAAPALLPGSDCAVGVRFIPSAAGPRRARLVIRHNAGEGVSVVELVGEGLGGT